MSFRINELLVQTKKVTSNSSGNFLRGIKEYELNFEKGVIKLIYRI